MEPEVAVIPDKKQDKNILLKAADQALYTAKKRDRNQVVVSADTVV